MTNEQIWEAIEFCFTGDEARRMGLSLSLFAREILARQPAAINKQAVAAVRDNPDDYGTIIEPIGDAVLPVGTELYATPLANEASKPAAPKNPKDAPEVWQGDSNAALAWACGWNECLEARAALTSANVQDERKYTQADMERYGKCYADARDARRANVAQGAEAVATVKVYETYTGQDGWIEVTQEEYDRTKDKYEHRIRRVPAPPVQTALTDDAREPHIPTKRLLHLADQAGIIPDKRAVAFYKAIKAEHAAQSASGDKS